MKAPENSMLSKLLGLRPSVHESNRDDFDDLYERVKRCCAEINASVAEMEFLTRPEAAKLKAGVSETLKQAQECRACGFGQCEFCTGGDNCPCVCDGRKPIKTIGLFFSIEECERMTEPGRTEALKYHCTHPDALKHLTIADDIGKTTVAE